MRLRILDDGHDETATKRVERWQVSRGMRAPDTVRLLSYRPEFLGRAFDEVVREVFSDRGDWTEGELQLFATFVSRRNQCPF